MKKILTQLTGSQQVQCQILIQSHPLFSHLPPEVSINITNLFIICEYQPGDVIVRENDEVDCIYFIASGIALVSRTFSQMDSIDIAILKSGDTIGLSDSGFYSATLKRCATVTAKSKIKLFCLKIDKLNSYFAVHSDFSDTIQDNMRLLLRIHFIKELSELSHLSSASVLFLANKIEEMTVPASEYIFHENEEGNLCYLLISGQVEILLGTQCGDEIKRLTILSAPAIFGEATLVTSLKRNASVKTLEECRLLTIDKKTLLKALEDNPLVAKLISELIERRKQGRDKFFRLTKNGWIAF